MKAPVQRIAYISVHGCPVRRLGEKDTGGMNVYLMAMARELGRRGIEVDVFTRVHDLKDPQVIPLGERARVVHLQCGPAGEDKEAIHPYLPEFIHNLVAFTEGHKLHYDLIHSHYWLSAEVASALKARWGVPLVTTFHTLGEVKRRMRPGQRESRVRLLREREAVQEAAAIFAFTAEEKAHLVHLYRARPEKVHVLPGGVDLELFRPHPRSAARRALALAEGEKVVLYVGRIEPFKGTDLLLRAVAALEDRSGVKVLVVGGGSNGRRDPEMARLQALAAELGVSGLVDFAGSVAQEQLPLYYSAADVCVVPSWYETWGFVAVEAMACGLPVLATEVGGLRRTVQDGATGYLVPWRCPEPFAERLELLLENESLRRSMGAAARSRVGALAWPAVAEQVLRVYHSLRRNGSSPGG